MFPGPTVESRQNVFKSGIVGRVVKKGEPPHSAIEHLISQAASAQARTKWLNPLVANPLSTRQETNPGLFPVGLYLLFFYTYIEVLQSGQTKTLRSPSPRNARIGPSWEITNTVEL